MEKTFLMTHEQLKGQHPGLTPITGLLAQEIVVDYGLHQPFLLLELYGADQKGGYPPFCIF